LQQAFEKKLARYALAGSALLGVPAAHAGTVYSGIIDSTATVGNPVAIDITGGGGDFSFSLIPDSGSTIHIVATANTGNFFNDGLTPLTAGTPITLVNTNTTGGELMKSPDLFPSGPWASQSGFAYLGLRFTMSAQEYLGWAQISINQGAPSLTLRDYGYNDVAGGSINAGDSGAVPEPSSLALFAMGAAGVVALRRRRKAA
jgi:hypothetical protein